MKAPVQKKRKRRVKMGDIDDCSPVQKQNKNKNGKDTLCDDELVCKIKKCNARKSYVKK